jgi:UDP-3-O-[3-hydroxymyristoyl] glucosamine N-acyltransferase
MEIKIKDAAELIGGKIFGNENTVIKKAAKIEEALPGDITFLYHPAYEKYFESTKASVIVVKENFSKTRDDIVYIEVEKPDASFQKIIIEYFCPQLKIEGISDSAKIDGSSKIGSDVACGNNVVISSNCKIGNNSKILHNTVIMENVSIGEDCIVYPNVTIREDSIIGDRVIIHSGTVIGSDGFGYTPDENGRQIKIPQIGNVILEDDVELGSNVSVDRAALGSTIIKKGAKIDNLVQIAHNVVVGENTVISAQSGISGSTKVGSNCMFGGQVGLVGHVEIADKVFIGAQSGVSKGIPKAGVYFGSPAKEIKTALKQEAHVRNLPKHVEKIKELENKIKLLEEKFNNILGENS